MTGFFQDDAALFHGTFQTCQLPRETDVLGWFRKPARRLSSPPVSATNRVTSGKRLDLSKCQFAHR